MKPYYEESGITLYLGDCREIIPQLEAVQMVLTDPPYNAGKNYGVGTDDRQEWPAWCAWFDEILTLSLAKSRDGVMSFLSQTAYKKYVRLGIHDPYWTAVWHKRLSMGICASPFMPHWEPIPYWGPVRRRAKGKGEQWGSDVIEGNVEFGKTRWNHPTPKPYLVMTQLVSRFDGPILDPFAGSGTTLHAAKDLRRKAIGIEIEERHCETIAERLNQSVMQFGSRA